MACTANERNVLILGKVGSGKRTLGNYIVGGDTHLFQVEHRQLGTGNVKAHYGERTREGTHYRIQIIDTESSQTRFNDPRQHINKEELQNIHLIIFAIPNGLYTDESHTSLQHAIDTLSQRAKLISALVFTRCEEMETSERKSIVDKFRDNPVSSKVVAFMEKGIHVLGFPDTSIMPPKVKPILQQRINNDEEAIRKLVESCDSPIKVEDLVLPNKPSNLDPNATVIKQLPQNASATATPTQYNSSDPLLPGDRREPRNWCEVIRGLCVTVAQACGHCCHSLCGCCVCCCCGGCGCCCGCCHCKQGNCQQQELCINKAT